MNGNDNRPQRRPIENMHIPSIEERKTPYVRPAAQETPPPKPSVAPDVAPSNEIADDNIGIPAPAMDYYPLVGRKRKVSYGPSSADIEAYSFLALLCSMIALVVFVLCAYSGYIFNKATGSYLSIVAQASDKLSLSDAVSPLSEADYFGSGGSSSVTDPVDPDAPYDYSSSVPVSSPADDAYFSDAVFVGDSRTEGLWLYSKIKSTFVCERGLNVSKFFSDTLDKYDSKTAFEELCSTECNKIYISFGINEIGWVASAFIKQYGELIDKVKAAKPDAVIYVQNIFPMSKEQSDKAIYGDNAKLRDYNERIAEMCREKEVYLLDVASYFSDENGDLKASYETGVDGAHFKAGGQGYIDWANYIRSHTVGQ